MLFWDSPCLPFSDGIIWVFVSVFLLEWNPVAIFLKVVRIHCEGNGNLSGYSPNLRGRSVPGHFHYQTLPKV